VRSRPYVGFAIATLASDVAMANLSVFLAYYLRFHTGLASSAGSQSWGEYVTLGVLESLLFPTVFAMRGLYGFRRSISRLDELQKVFTTVSIGMVLAMAISAFLSRGFEYSRGLLTLSWALAILLIWLARLALHYAEMWIIERRGLNERVLVVGAGDMGRSIIQRVRASPRLGYYAAAAIRAHEGDESETQVEGVPIVGGLGALGEAIDRHDVTEVVIAEPSLTQRELLDAVAECERRRINIKVFPSVFQMISSAVDIGDLNGLPMVSVRDAALRGWRLTVKRGVDLLVSSLLLVVLSPIMLLIALAVKLSSPGPVFFVQDRVGLDGQPFQVLKFRSMRADAEAASGPVWAKEGDPRRTAVGSFIRRLSLDELPQFINVLLGEMSVVGPRPERPYFVQEFSRRVPRYLDRHREKAGLTGWAQVNGLRGDVSIEERTAYDLWYVENWTLWLDFKIMLRTIFSIFRGRNAY